MSSSIYGSIITVCMNEVQAIRQTCESICNQSSFSYEWIVIDGVSSDGTLDILREYESRISILISEPDNGIFNAMNKGLKMATGDYVVFLNGGDRFASENVLELVYQAPAQDMIIGDIYLKTNDELQLVSFPDYLPHDYLLWNWLPHPSAFVRRELLLEQGGFDESFRIAADHEMFTRLTCQGISYHHINEALACFSMNGISTDMAHKRLMDKERHLIRKKYFPQYRYSLKGLRRGLRLYLSEMRS